MSKPPPKEEMVSNVMGTLRCVEERSGRKLIANYKKRFFVLNARQRTLDMYKNDQTPIPIEQIAAGDMRNVVYSGDKQNRFYMMTLQMRMGVSIKFRMNSFEEREMWFNAVNTLIEKSATHNRRQSIDSLIRRKLQRTSKYLKVDITLGHSTILTEIEDDLLQFVPEAVALLVSTVTELVRMYENEVRRPRHYRLMVCNANDSGEPQLSPPRYDPYRATVVLYVLISRDAMGRVQFSSTKAMDVDRILSSEIFRNPLIEGWIDREPGCRDLCNEMQRLLSTPQTKANVLVTFEWELYDNNSDQVKLYLRKFVSFKFFKRRVEAVRHAIQDVTTLVEETQSAAANLQHVRTGSFVSPLPSPRNAALGGAGGGGEVSGGNISGMRAAHSRSHSSTSATGLTQPNVVMTGLTSAHPSGSAAEVHCLAVRLIADNITGLPIRLDARRVETCEEPPVDIVTFSATYETVCRPALLLLGDARDLLVREDGYALALNSPDLREQLFVVGFHAFVAQKLTSLNARLRSLFRKKIRVKIDWRSMFDIFRARQVQLTPKDLVHTVEVFADMYVSRLEHLAHFLGRADNFYASGADPLPTGNRPYDVFLACVRCILVTFCAYEARPASLLSAAIVAEPTIQGGILTDTMYCSDEASIQIFLNSALFSSSTAALGSTTTLSGQGARRPIPLGHDMYTLAAAPRLGRWVEEYFAVVEHYHPVSKASIALDDGFYSDDERSEAEEEGMMGDRRGADRADLDDAVAYERSAEIRVLNTRGVVNKVYDSQGSALGLMISAIDIRDAMRSFKNSFPHQTVSKHNIMHTLIFNLHRLRALYVRVADSEDVTALTEEEATQLLRDFCEYTENEKLIPHALRMHRRSDAILPTADTEDGPAAAATDDSGATDVPKVDFVMVSRVALNCLLPAEAHVARRAQRVGFVWGLKNTGKTLLINSMRGIARPTVATVGLSRQLVCFEEWVLAMHELGGSDSFSRNWRFYARRLEEVHFLIFVVDFQDRPSFPVVQRYLRRLTKFFAKPIPVVVVLNNYRDPPRAISKEAAEGYLAIEDLRKRRQNRKRSIFTCRCNVSVVAPENVEMPSELRTVMQQVSAELLAATPPAERPSAPKAVGTPEPSLAALTFASVASPVQQNTPNRKLMLRPEGVETSAPTRSVGAEADHGRGETPCERSATGPMTVHFERQAVLSTTRDDDTPRSLDDTLLSPETAPSPYMVHVPGEAVGSALPTDGEMRPGDDSSQGLPHRHSTQLPHTTATGDKSSTDEESEDLVVDVPPPKMTVRIRPPSPRMPARHGESFRSPSISERGDRIIYATPPTSRSKTRGYPEQSPEGHDAEVPPPAALHTATCRTVTPMLSRTEASLEVHEPFGHGGDEQQIPSSHSSSPPESESNGGRKMTLQPEPAEEKKRVWKKRHNA